MNITAQVNVSKKDIFNAKSGSISVKDVLDDQLIATGAFIAKDEGVRKGSGEVCDIGYIVTDKGVVGFSSEVALKAMPDFIDYITDECASPDFAGVPISFDEHDGKAGKFYTFSLI